MDWQSGHKYGDHFGHDDPKASTFDDLFLGTVGSWRVGKKPKFYGEAHGLQCEAPVG